MSEALRDTNGKLDWAMLFEYWLLTILAVSYDDRNYTWT